MTLRHLKIFLAVCRCNHITHAAEQLHLTQPAVTRAIQEIEQFYGVQLFDRIARQLYITESGRRFYADALHIVESFDAMEQGLRNEDAFGELRIGASITIGNYLLPRLALECRQLAPQLRLRAQIQNSQTLQTAVLQNELDLALIEGAALSSELIVQPFMDDQLVLLVPPGHPLLEKSSVFLQDLTAYDFILREKGSAGREIFDSALLLQGIHLSPVWESVSTQAIIKAVAAGLGISVLPYLLVKSDLEQGSVCTVRVEDAPFRRQFSVIYHRNKFVSSSMKTVLTLCGSEFAAQCLGASN